MDQSAQVWSTTLRSIDVLMRRLPSHIALSGGAFRRRGLVVPYPTMVIGAPSDRSSVPGSAKRAGVIPDGAYARKTSPTSAMPGSSGATRLSSVGSHCGGAGQCGMEGCVANRTTGIHVL